MYYVYRDEDSVMNNLLRAFQYVNTNEVLNTKLNGALMRLPQNAQELRDRIYSHLVVEATLQWAKVQQETGNDLQYERACGLMRKWRRLMSNAEEGIYATMLEEWVTLRASKPKCKK